MKILLLSLQYLCALFLDLSASQFYLSFIPVIFESLLSNRSCWIVAFSSLASNLPAPTRFRLCGNAMFPFTDSPS